MARRMEYRQLKGTDGQLTGIIAEVVGHGWNFDAFAGAESQAVKVRAAQQFKIPAMEKKRHTEFFHEVGNGPNMIVMGMGVDYCQRAPAASVQNFGNRLGIAAGVHDQGIIFVGTNDVAILPPTAVSERFNDAGHRTPPK